MRPESRGPGVGPAEVQHFVYDGVVQGVDADKHVALRFDNGSQVSNRYLHGALVDQVLADEQVTDSQVPGSVFWPLTGNLRTVRDLAQYDDATGITEIANHLTYDAFGQVTSETDAAIEHLFGYTGRERDYESGLYYYRARYYDPAIRRFASEDPIGFEARDPNLFRYVANNPLNATDPSGLTEQQVSGVPDALGHLRRVNQQLRIVLDSLPEGELEHNHVRMLQRAHQASLLKKQVEIGIYTTMTFGVYCAYVTH